MLKKAKLRKCSISGVVFLGFMLLVYAPYEIMIPNIAEMDIPFSLYVGIPICLFAIYIVIAITIALLVDDKLYRLLEGLVFILSICIYVQGNFLGMRQGILNGDAVNWDNYWGEILLNGLVLQILFFLLVFLWSRYQSKMEKVMSFISKVLLGAQIVSLIVVVYLNWGDITVKNDVKRYSTQDEIMTLSKDKTNVVWFLLDMYDDDYFDKISVLDKDIIDKLDGFTNFTNCSGVYPTTNYSMAMLMTGKLFLNEMDLSDWIEEKKEEGIWLDELVNDDYDIYGYSPFYYTLPPLELKNYEYGKAKIRSYPRFAIQMYKLVANKYGPDLIKPLIWMDGSEFDYWKGYTSEHEMATSDNSKFGQIIDENEISFADNKVFKYYYLVGAHYPYTTDSQGNRVKNGDSSAIECAEGVIRTVEKYIEKLKESGTYDNTVIVICADHGFYRHGTLTSPLMLIKPTNSHGNMVVNTAPVSQLDLPATILQLANISNYQLYGQSMFDISQNTVRERFFYQYNFYEGWSFYTHRLIQYIVDCEDNKTDNFHLTNVEYTCDGYKIEHEKYCRTCRGIVYDDDWTVEENWPYLVHLQDTSIPLPGKGKPYRTLISRE